MPDDIITVGGRGRRSELRRDSDEAIESLFHAHYARLVHTAFSMIDDWDLAEQLVRKAYLRVWQRWPRIADPQAAPRYLRRTVVDLSGGTIRRRVIGADAEPGRRPQAVGSPLEERAVDAGRAWRELRERRSQEVLGRRKRLAAGAVALAAAAVATIAAVAVAGSNPAVRAPGLPGTGRVAAAAVRSYPQAVVARIPMAGFGPVAQDRGQLWAVRFSGGDPTYYPVPVYYLVRIDLRTNKIGLQIELGRKVRMVAAGGGMVWLTTPYGQAAGQIVRLDPATGRVLRTLHLPTGKCTYIAYVAGRLTAECTSGAHASDFLWINTNNGRVIAQAGPARWPPAEIPGPGAAAAAPQGAWFITSTGISGLVGTGSRKHLVTVNDPAYPVSFAYTVSLAYGDGFIWALTNDESVAKIDPATGKVLQVYTYATYDPGYDQGLTWLAVGHGSIWFADNGAASGNSPFQGVLRVSAATGTLTGRIPASGPLACAGACYRIYSTPGGIWLLAAKSLIRIDPVRLPG